MKKAWQFQTVYEVLWTIPQKGWRLKIKLDKIKVDVNLPPTEQLSNWTEKDTQSGDKMCLFALRIINW